MANFAATVKLFFSPGVLAQYPFTSVTESKFLIPLPPAVTMQFWKRRLGSFYLTHQLQHCQLGSLCRIFITADDVREKEYSLINRLLVEFTTLAAKNDLLIYKLRTFNIKVLRVNKYVQNPPDHFRNQFSIYNYNINAIKKIPSSLFCLRSVVC